MSGFRKSIFIESEAKMQELAQAIAEIAQQGDVLLLDGELGTGKSFFSRQFIKHLGQKQIQQNIDVPSPTFTLVQTYDQLNPPVWHFDLYRLSGPEEAYDLGLEDAVKNAICLIEWPSRLENDVPQNCLNLFFKHDDLTSRQLEFVMDRAWAARLEPIFKS